MGFGFRGERAKRLGTTPQPVARRWTEGDNRPPRVGAGSIRSGTGGVVGSHRKVLSGKSAELGSVDPRREQCKHFLCRELGGEAAEKRRNCGFRRGTAT